MVDKKLILLITVLVVIVSESMAQKDHNINIDLGKIFRMGLLTGKGGTKLGINVLNGLVNVGVDRKKFQSAGDQSLTDPYEAQESSDTYDRPVRIGVVRDRIRNKIINRLKGQSDVNVSVGLPFGLDQILNPPQDNLKPQK